MAASRGTAAPGHRDLWQEAFTKLSRDAQSQLDKLAGRALLSTTISQDMDSLMTLAEEKRKTCDRETWKCKVGGREIILRDYAVRVMGGLALAGDVAVEFIPGPAKVVWPVLKGVMSVSGPASPVDLLCLRSQRGHGRRI